MHIYFPFSRLACCVLKNGWGQKVGRKNSQDVYNRRQFCYDYKTKVIYKLIICHIKNVWYINADIIISSLLWSGDGSRMVWAVYFLSIGLYQDDFVGSMYYLCVNSHPSQ